MSLTVEIAHRLGDFMLEARFASAGRVTALFGRSGAGKTTLVNAIAGLVRPAYGRIEVEGETLLDTVRGISVPRHRRRIGYVFQEGRLFPHLTVRRNLRYGTWFAPREGRYVEFDRVIETLGIAHLLDRKPGTLSGGERQRVAIGRALLASPRLLLMDEPLASLDAARRHEVLAFIERMRDAFSIPIVYVSHAMDEVIRLADTLVLVDGGRIAAVGPVEELLSRLDLRPLTGRYEAGAVIAARVAGSDDAFALTHLDFPGGTLRVARIDAPPGAEVRVRIRARDVSLALTRPADISVLNIFEGTVREVAADPDDPSGAQLDVRLDIGVPLWARITRRSARDLGIAPGRRVHALVKSVAIDRGSLGPR
jgi:molybdate transport system ATP-binding protein